MANRVFAIMFLTALLQVLFVANGSGEDARELSVGVAYSWRQWRMVAAVVEGLEEPWGRYLFIWGDAAALDFRSGFNGWFDFLLDGRVSVMSPDGSRDVRDRADRDWFVPRLLRVWRGVNNTALEPVLSEPGDTEYVHGQWRLTSKKENELVIQDDFVTIILREDLPGFVYVLENKQQRFTAKTKLNEIPELSKQKLILLQPTTFPTPQTTASLTPQPTASPTSQPTASPVPTPTVSPVPQSTASPVPKPIASPAPETPTTAAGSMLATYIGAGVGAAVLAGLAVGAPVVRRCWLRRRPQPELSYDYAAPQNVVPMRTARQLMASNRRLDEDVVPRPHPRPGEHPYDEIGPVTAAERRPPSNIYEEIQ